jgi:hypothetical protein
VLACDMIVVTAMDVLTTTLEYGSTPVFIVTVAVFVAFLASYRSSAGCTRVCTGIVCPLSIDSQCGYHHESSQVASAVYKY